VRKDNTRFQVEVPGNPAAELEQKEKTLAGDVLARV
jgi:hypothetical protein